MKKEKKENPTKPHEKPGVKGEYTTDKNQTSPGIVAHEADKQK